MPAPSPGPDPPASETPRSDRPLAGISERPAANPFRSSRMADPPGRVGPLDGAAAVAEPRYDVLLRRDGLVRGPLDLHGPELRPRAPQQPPPRDHAGRLLGRDRVVRPRLHDLPGARRRRRLAVRLPLLRPRAPSHRRDPGPGSGGPPAVLRLGLAARRRTDRLHRGRQRGGRPGGADRARARRSPRRPDGLCLRLPLGLHVHRRARLPGRRRDLGAPEEGPLPARLDLRRPACALLGVVDLGAEVRPEPHDRRERRRRRASSSRRRSPSWPAA